MIDVDIKDNKINNTKTTKNISLQKMTKDGWATVYPYTTAENVRMNPEDGATTVRTTIIDIEMDINHIKKCVKHNERQLKRSLWVNRSYKTKKCIKRK